MYQSRRIIIMVVGFILVFFLLLVASFYIYPVINPDVNLSYENSEMYMYDYAQFGPQAVAELKKKVDALEFELNDKRAKEKNDLALIDSLYQATLRLEDELSLINSGSGYANGGGVSSLNKLNVDPKVQEVIEVLMRLNEEDLEPILSRLTDPMLFQLYEVTGKTQRIKILQALEPSKSAALLKRVMS